MNGKRVKNRRVLVIGLDGATFDILKPLIGKGCLPNLERFIQNGASATLLSTIPPITGPAWFALATGKSPGKTGIYDFLVVPKKGGYRLRSVNSDEFIGCSVWDYLSQRGRRVGILNYPLLRPPYPVNGFMVSGLGTVPGEDFTFPKSLREELDQVIAGPYETTLPLSDPRYHDIELFFKDVYRVFEKQLRAAEYLLKEKPWDFLWIVFSQSDWVQHRLWGHIDQTHPFFEVEKSERYSDAFSTFWAMIDEKIGRLYEIAGDDTNIIILSDHGSGPHDQVFKLNAWLEAEGYLFRKRNSIFIPIRNTADRFLKWLALQCSRTNLVPSIFYRWGRQSLGGFHMGILNQVDLERSVAFDPGHTIPFGGIYVNEQVIHDSRARQKVADEIEKKLKKWGSTNSVGIEIWRPSAQDRDGKISRCPDLLVGINNWRCVILKDFLGRAIFEQRPYSPIITGYHRPDGILIGFGPDIKRTRIEKVEICDIAPTVLFMFDQVIPSEMDGRVLLEMFDTDYLKSHSITIADEGGIPPETTGGRMSDEEEEAFRKQLKDLGYL